MAEYIDREATRNALYEADAITMKGVEIINNFPAADVVPTSVLRQVRWERDQAMRQLQDHGISFGAIAPDVVKVVRCEDCRFDILREDGTFGCYRHFMEWHKPDDFCSYGERRSDNDTN